MFKKNNSRKAAKPQRTAFDSPLRLCAFAREKYLFFRRGGQAAKVLPSAGLPAEGRVIN